MGIARLNAPELTKGALSIAFVKNPNDPIWAKDPAVALYRTIMKRYDPAGKPTDVYHWYGMTVAWSMVETLQRAGKTPTRASLLEAARPINTTANPFMLPGIRLRTTAATTSRSTPSTSTATTTSSGSRRAGCSPRAEVPGCTDDRHRVSRTSYEIRRNHRPGGERMRDRSASRWLGRRSRRSPCSRSPTAAYAAYTSPTLTVSLRRGATTASSRRRAVGDDATARRRDRDPRPARRITTTQAPGHPGRHRQGAGQRARARRRAAAARRARSSSLLRAPSPPRARRPASRRRRRPRPSCSCCTAAGPDDQPAGVRAPDRRRADGARRRRSSSSASPRRTSRSSRAAPRSARSS